MTSPTSTIVDQYGAVPQIVLRYPDPTDQKWSAFNPSIAKSSDGQKAVTIRSSNYYIDPTSGVTTLLSHRTIRSRTWFAFVKDDLTLQGIREVKFEYPSDLHVERGVEDARLFWRDGWYFTAVMWEPPLIKYTRICLFQYDPDTNVAKFVKMYGSPVESRSEKNWMPPDTATDKFDYIYSTSQVVVDEQFVGVYQDMEKSIQPGKYLSSIRGGTQLVLQDDGTHLAVVHDVEVEIKKVPNPNTFAIHRVYRRDYTHYFARFSEKGALTHLSPRFIFKRQGIEYAAGMVEDGDDLIVSYGAFDVFACMVRVNKQKVIDSLQSVEA